MAVEPLLGTRAQRAFITTVGVQAVIVIAMVASTFGIVEAYLGDIFDLTTYKTLSCYLSLFLLAGMFEFIVTFDALWYRNIIQLLGIIMFHGALIVFSTLQVHETRIALRHCGLSQCSNDNEWLFRKVEPFLVVVPCIVAVSWFSLTFWVKQLFNEFEWSICDIVNKDPASRSMYLFYQIFVCLLKFDLFCFIGVTMQLLIVVITTDSEEFRFTVAAVPVAFCFVIGCAYSAKYEIKWMMSIGLASMVPCMCFSEQLIHHSFLATEVVYKLAHFYLPSSEGEYVTTRTTLTVFTVVAFLLLLITFSVGIKCFFDFDKGLLSSKTSAFLRTDTGQTYSLLARPRSQMFDDIS